MANVSKRMLSPLQQPQVWAISGFWNTFKQTVEK
jgi:hypothetical protein